MNAMIFPRLFTFNEGQGFKILNMISSRGQENTDNNQKKVER